MTRTDKMQRIQATNTPFRFRLAAMVALKATETNWPQPKAKQGRKNARA